MSERGIAVVGKNYDDLEALSVNGGLVERILGGMMDVRGRNGELLNDLGVLGIIKGEDRLPLILIVGPELVDIFNIRYQSERARFFSPKQILTVVDMGDVNPDDENSVMEYVVRFRPRFKDGNGAFRLENTGWGFQEGEGVYTNGDLPYSFYDIDGIPLGKNVEEKAFVLFVGCVARIGSNGDRVCVATIPAQE